MTTWSVDTPLFLIGPMGTGKSYLGRQLADLIGVPFTDLDVRIEEKCGMTIAELFRNAGERTFRELEAATLREMRTGVVATGGGTPCFHENMDWMNRHGYTLYLAADPNLLARRLERERSHRPLLARVEVSKLPAFLEDLIRARAAYYEQAQICFYQEHEQPHPEKLIYDLIRQVAPPR